MKRPRYSTPNGILAAAHELGITRSEFRQLPGSRALNLLHRLLESFTVGGLKNRDRVWLWEVFREPRSSALRCVDRDLLRALGEPATPVWLVVEDDSRRKRRPAFWIFEATLDAAARTLENHHLLEFYIVSRDFEWLLAENHHDVTIAVGEHAVAALRKVAPAGVGACE